MAYQCEFLLHLQQVPLQNNKTSLEMLVIYLSHLLIQRSSYLSLLVRVIGIINLNYNGERHIYNRLDSSQEMVSKLGFALQGCILDLHIAISVLLNSKVSVTAKEICMLRGSMIVHKVRFRCSYEQWFLTRK